MQPPVILKTIVIGTNDLWLCHVNIPIGAPENFLVSLRAIVVLLNDLSHGLLSLFCLLFASRSIEKIVNEAEYCIPPWEGGDGEIINGSVSLLLVGASPREGLDYQIQLFGLECQVDLFGNLVDVSLFERIVSHIDPLLVGEIKLST